MSNLNKIYQELKNKYIIYNLIYKIVNNKKYKKYVKFK